MATIISELDKKINTEAVKEEEVGKEDNQSRISDADRLCRAAQINDIDKFKEILAKGVPLNSVSRGFQAIHHAANSGSMEVLRLILELAKKSNDIEIIQARTPKGKLAIHLAEKNKHMECYKLLQEAGLFVGRILTQRMSQSLQNLPPIVPRTYSSDEERNAAFEAEKKDMSHAALYMNQVLSLAGRKLGTVTLNGVPVFNPADGKGSAPSKRQ